MLLTIAAFHPCWAQQLRNKYPSALASLEVLIPTPMQAEAEEIEMVKALGPSTIRVHGKYFIPFAS